MSAVSPDNQIVEYDKNADMRDFKAVKRIATAAKKLFFPHWKTVEDIKATIKISGPLTLLSLFLQDLFYAILLMTAK